MNAVAKPAVFTVVNTKVEVDLDTVKGLLCNLFEAANPSWLFKIKNRNYGPDVKPEDFGSSGKLNDSKNYYHPTQIIPVTEGCSLTLIVENPNNIKPLEFTLDCDSIKKGLQVMADMHPDHWADVITENDDAITADIFGQCVVYGEVLFC